MEEFIFRAEQFVLIVKNELPPFILFSIDSWAAQRAWLVGGRSRSPLPLTTSARQPSPANPPVAGEFRRRGIIGVSSHERVLLTKMTFDDATTWLNPGMPPTPSGMALVTSNTYAASNNAAGFGFFWAAP
jgi:hypothetical protein